MSAASAHLPLWDRDNVEEGRAIHGTPLADSLTHSLVTLYESLQLDDIWPHLKELKILKRTEVEKLKHNKARPQQVEDLLDYILQAPRWKYHGLMRAMALTGQTHLIPKGGPDPKVYTNDETKHEVAEDTCPPLEQQLLKSICDHCEYYDEYLMRAHIFAFEGDPGDDYIDIAPCYIDVWPNMKDGNKVMVPIDVTKILDKIGDKPPPRVIRLYAQPGDGKTSFTMNVARSWSKAFLNQVTNEGGKLSFESKCPLWTTMVFIKARNIKTTVEDAIHEELGCKEEDEDILMAHITKGDGVAILIEAMDELRDHKALGELNRYVKKCKKKGGPTVLITSRTDLCYIDGQDFDRFLTLEGFSEEQALQYVKLYTESCKVQPPTDPLLPLNILEHVTRHKEKMKAVLSNPLQLHLYCALVMRGEIEPSGTDEFSIPKLFGPLERYLLKRGGIKVTKEQSNAFYQLCMHAILNDIREFPRALLDHFHIVEPYHVFLNKSDRRGHDGGLEPHYSFGHEVVLEYFASRYIYSLNSEDQSSFLLLACCDDSWRNIQKILIQMLVQEGEAQIQLVKTMLRSILILQFEGSSEELPMILADLMHLKEQIVIPSKETLCSKVGKLSTENIFTIHEKINDVFENHADQLRAASWLRNVHGYPRTFQHVVDCITTVPSDLRDILIKDSVLHLMPGKYSDPSFTDEDWCYTVGGARWANVNASIGGTVEAWSPVDATDALLQHATMCPEQCSKGFNELDMSQHIFNDLWGMPDEDTWSREHWQNLLKVMQKGRGGHLSITVPETAPLGGLLLSLIDNAQELSQFQGINILYGTVNLDELVKCISRCRNDLDLRLRSTCIFVSENLGAVESQMQKSSVQCAHGQWENNSLTIRLKEKAPLTDLLLYLVDNSEHLSQCREIRLQHGAAKLDDLMTSMRAGKEAGLKLSFFDTNIDAESLVHYPRTDNNICCDESLARVEGASKVHLTSDHLSVGLFKTGPLIGLLSYLIDNAVHFSEYKDISLKGGTADFQDLLKYLSMSKQQELSLRLKDTCIIVSSIRKTKEEPDNSPKEALQVNISTRVFLCFAIAEHSSPVGLLSHLPGCKDHLAQWKTTDVTHGTADLGDLMKSVTSCHQAGINLKLNDVELMGNILDYDGSIGRNISPSKVILHKGFRNGLCIKVDDTATPLTGLLQYLLDCAVNMPLISEISVYYGTIELPDLVLWMSKYEKAGLHLTFSETHVVVPEMVIAMKKGSDGLGNTATPNHPVEVVFKHWPQYVMTFCLQKKTPLAGLFSWLMIHEGTLSRFPIIRIEGGTADLCGLMDLCKEARLAFELVNVHIVLSGREYGGSAQLTGLIHVGHGGWKDRMMINLDEKSSLTCLHSFLLDQAAYLARYESIIVGGGRAELGKLLISVSRCRQKGQELELNEVNGFLLHKTLEEENAKQCESYTTLDQNAVLQIKLNWKVTNKSEFIRIYPVDYKLSIAVDETTPLTAIVSCLLARAAHQKEYTKVALHSGTAQFNDIVRWVSNKDQSKRQFEFYNTNVIVTGGGTNLKSQVCVNLKVWMANSVLMSLSKDLPLMRLLPPLLDHAVHLSQYSSIVVANATATFVELVTCISRCKQEGVHLTLTEVIMTPRQQTEAGKVHHQLPQKCQQELNMKLQKLAWTKNVFCVTLDRTCILSVNELLSQLPDCSQHLSEYDLIQVIYGTAKLCELDKCLSRCQETGLQLIVYDVLISESVNVYTTSTSLECKRRMADLVIRKMCSKYLYIEIDRQISLADVLSQLYEQAVDLSSVEQIVVSNGSIEFAEMLLWVGKYAQVGLTLALKDTHILIPEMLTSNNQLTKDETQKPVPSVVGRERVGECLQIIVDQTISLTALLSYFHEHAADLSLVKNLVVSNGCIKLADVMTWMSRFKLAAIDLTWTDTQVVVHDRLKADEYNAIESKDKLVTSLAQPTYRLPYLIQAHEASLQNDAILNPMVKKWSRYVLDIILLKTTPQARFLEWLMEHSRHLSQCQRITVKSGTAKLDDLMTCLFWYELNGFNLQILHSSIVVDQKTTHEEDNVLQLLKLELIGDKVMIDLHVSTPVTRLLSHLIDHAPCLSWYDSINVRYGTADLGDLLLCLGDCRQAGLTLELQDTYVLLPRISTKTSQSESKADNARPPGMRISWWVKNPLTLDLDWTVKVTDLLSVFLTHPEHLSWCESILVLHGTAKLDDLMSYVCQCRHARLKLELGNTHITGLDSLKYQENFSNNHIYVRKGRYGTHQLAIQGMDMKWVNDSMILTLPTAAPVTYLLSGLLDQMMHRAKPKEIVVKYGTAELDDLMIWVSRFKREGPPLKLYQPYVIVSDKPIDKTHSLEERLNKDPTILVMLDGWDIHTVLF